MAARQVAELPDGDPRGVRIPFMGASVCAGFPSPADDFLEEAVNLPRWVAPNPPATFLWRVAGWSVVNAGIHDGDIVVVDCSLRAVAGDIVLAVIDAVPSLKRYRVVDGRAMLAFDSPDHPEAPIEGIGEATISGVVRLSFRLHRALARGRQ